MLKILSGCKNICWLAGLLFCLMVVACPEPLQTGELEPLPNGAAQITTSRFDNDTLLFTENGLSVKIYGEWQAAIGLRVAVKNETGNEVIIKFNEMTAENGNQERAEVGDIVEEQKEGDRYFRHARVGEEMNRETPPPVKILAGEKRKFVVVFSNVFNSRFFNFGDDAAGNTFYFTLPIEVRENNNKLYQAVFNKIEDKVSNKADPKPW